MNGATLRPEAAGDGGVGSPSMGDRCGGQGHVDRYAAHLCIGELLGGLQQCGWVWSAAGGLLLCIPGLACCLADESFVAGGDGKAAPTGIGALHKGDAAGLMGRPGGVYAEDAEGVFRIRLNGQFRSSAKRP